MTNRIYRYVISTDGEPHDFLLSGPIRAAGSRVVDAVEFWAEHDSDAVRVTRRLVVAGTGQALPDQYVYRGHTFDALNLSLVWHLIEVCSEDPKSHPENGHPGVCPVCWPHA